MPELPEVETVRRGLHGLLIGRTIAAETHDTAKGFPNAPTDVQMFVIGATVTDVRRRAKVLMIDLSTNYTLVIHLKMTGQLVFVDKSLLSEKLKLEDSEPLNSHHQASAGTDEVRFGAGHPNDSLIGVLPDSSTRVTLTFDDGTNMYFNDQRKFGWVMLLPTAEVIHMPFMQKVGPEPLESDFTVEQFAARFTRRGRTSIKAALLDQSVVAGVGNIYADESLWGARIHPQRLVNTITFDEFSALYTDLRAVMNLAIEKGGSTNKNYVNAEGKRGSYMDFARVFRREGLPCPRCGAEIIKFKHAGRGTHLCLVCQVFHT